MKIKTPNRQSKPKLEITKFSNRQNTMRIHGQPNRQLFSKRWPLSNPNRTKSIMNIYNVKRHRTLTSKTGNRGPHQIYRLGMVSYSYWGGGLKLLIRRQPRPQYLMWYNTFSWLFGSHDNHVTRQ